MLGFGYTATTSINTSVCREDAVGYPRCTAVDHDEWSLWLDVSTGGGRPLIGNVGIYISCIQRA